MLLDSRPVHPSSLLDQKLRDGLGSKEALEGEGCESCLFFLASWGTSFQSESPSSRLCSLVTLVFVNCQDSHVEHQLGTKGSCVSDLLGS